MMYTHDEETIVAQCTPQGKGAIALIRLSGIQAVSTAARMSKLASTKNLDELPSHTIHYGWIVTPQGSIIDQVMFFLMRAPRTFTGQDVVEITCHNNQFLIEAIIERAIQSGARLAKEGEFAKRAYLNGKIDLVQAEAINELIHASTQQALKQSLAQVEGSFSSWIERIQKELFKCLAFSDASFEFIDEEMEFGSTIKTIVDDVLDELCVIKKSYDQQQRIREGVRIALIGSVNAGKSSLFNVLLGKNRSIVADIAGTTRDTVEAGVYRYGNYCTFVDTAGLRNTDDCIEQEGIRRSMQEAAQADCILLIVDQSRRMTEQEKTIYADIIAQCKAKAILVYNKTDLPQVADQPFDLENILYVSTVHPESTQLLEQKLELKINQLLKQAESPFLLNKRQWHLLLALEQRLQDLKAIMQHNMAYEIISYHLKDALEHLSELSGQTISEKGMDAVFREFCVGK